MTIWHARHRDRLRRERRGNVLFGFIMFGFAFVVVMLIASCSVRAEWKPEYAQVAPALRDWYAHAQLTEAAQKRFSFTSCCAHSDVVHTRFRVGVKGADVWEFWDEFAAPSGWREVPADIIHWGEAAPDGQPTLFRLGAGGALTCFWPGESGN